MPHGGLALANSTATLLECAVLIVLLRRRLSGLEGNRLLTAALQSLVGAILMAAILWGWLKVAAGLPQWVMILGGIIFGGAAYTVSLLIIRVPEVFQARDFALEKIKAVLNRNA